MASQYFGDYLVLWQETGKFTRYGPITGQERHWLYTSPYVTSTMAAPTNLIANLQSGNRGRQPDVDPQWRPDI